MPQPSRSPDRWYRGRRSIRTTSRSYFGPPTPTRPTPGRPSIDSRARNLAEALVGELEVGLQERAGARERSVGLIELRRGRLKDVGRSRRDVQLDGDVGGCCRGGEARRVIQQHL